MAINKIDRVVLDKGVLDDLDGKATKQELQNTKEELQNTMNEIYQGIHWKETVLTFADLRIKYPDAKDGWTATAGDTNITYQYDVPTDTWFPTSINALPTVTSEVDGLMAREDKVKLNTVEKNAQKNLTDSQALEQIKRVDGLNSGLDADIFQGRLPDTFADKVHNHNGEYHTKTESNTLLNAKAQKEHKHNKVDIVDFEHTHPTSEVTGFGESVKSTILSGLSTATSVAITISDNVITAFGKLQAQTTSLLGNLNAHKTDSDNPHATTKAQVGLGDVDNTSDINKPVSTATSTELNKKVSKVTGKNLSDENYTLIEKNKLGEIETGANNYIHPLSHPADIITESTTKRFVSDAEKVKWDSKAEISQIPTRNSQLTNDSNYVTQADLGSAGYGDMTKSTYDTNNNGKVDVAENAEKVNGFSVATNVPAGAKFTDTITTVNGKTGAITKADVVALGVPAQDTVYSHPTTHPASMITGLHAVATGGSYTQLTNKPTKLSDFVDDVKPYYKDSLAPAKTDKLWLDTSK